MPITIKSIAKRRCHTCAKGLFHGEFRHSRATQPASILLNRRPGKTIHYLPTASGPMPIAAVLNGKSFAVHADHLNTPRRLTRNNGQVVWQWAYSAFGEEQPTLAKNRFANPETTPNAGTTNAPEVVFNLRYPGQYFDKESGLFYNYFRSYDARTGRYTQGDPIELEGGWNRYA